MIHIRRARNEGEYCAIIAHTALANLATATVSLQEQFPFGQVNSCSSSGSNGAAIDYRP